MKFQKFTQIGTREKNEDYLGNNIPTLFLILKSNFCS